MPARCAVIGAGMAGSSVAHAMALRGWHVTVLDQEAAPAGGASSLPAGLAVPHVSSDDSNRSRLTRRGLQLLAQHAQRFLLRGQDWDPCGVLERRVSIAPIWHPKAAWVKPSRLVDAWLAHPRVDFKGNTKIASIRHANDLWSLCDSDGKTVGEFEVVVVANAMGSKSLLISKSTAEVSSQMVDAELSNKLSSLQAIHGTLSHGTYAESIPNLPDMPVNGSGCFIPHLPGDSGEQWCAGSTFEADATAAADIWEQHSRNMRRLEQLLPGVGAELAETLDRGPVTQWTSTRCVTHDRLPIVGPVGNGAPIGLWLCIGMGSRGLSFSALCAELLAAQLSAEPFPLEISLARRLASNRPRRKRQGETNTLPIS